MTLQEFAIDYEHHRPEFERYAARFVDEHTAKDIVQQAAVALLVGGKYRQITRASFRAYFYGQINFQLKEYFRRRKRRKEEVFDAELAATALGPEESSELLAERNERERNSLTDAEWDFLRQETQAALREAIPEMNRRMLVAIALYWTIRDREEAASLMGVSVSAYDQLTFRARRILRSKFDARGIDMDQIPIAVLADEYLIVLQEILSQRGSPCPNSTSPTC
jgi:RNA polymerase sigma factor (sigma-70 family)